VEAAALAREVVKGMLISKLKVLGALALAACVLAAGAGLAARQATASRQPQTKHEDGPKPAAQDANKSTSTSPQQARSDRYGDPLPRKALARMGTVRWRLPRDLGYAAAFFPGGNKLVAADAYHSLAVFDAATGQILCRVSEDRALLRDRLQIDSMHHTTCMTFSADGRTLAYGEQDGAVRIVDARAGTERLRLTGHRALANSVALSADGRLLVTRSNDQTVRVWDAARGRQLHQFTAPMELRRSMSVALAPDCKTLAWIGKAGLTVHVCEVDSGKEKLCLRGDERWIARVVFSPDGRRLAKCH
jgi:WD40 repeat protein